MAEVVKWILTDTTTLDTWTFEINPNEGAAPEYRKNTSFTGTTAPDGRTLVSEGQDNVPDFPFSGTLLTQTQHDARVEWFDRRTIIKITDDFSRDWYVWIEGLRLERLRKHNYPWAHKYSVSAKIVE